MFVTVSRDGKVPPHARFHAEAWARQGFAVVLIAVVGKVTDAFDAEGLGWARGVLLRENRGYDFGAWAAAIDELPEVRSASRLAIVNDSVFGPFDGFAEMLARARNATADVIGLTANRRPVWHLQSFLLFFGPRALASAVFDGFWRGVRTGTRDLVIQHCELRLTPRLSRTGLRCDALFSSDPTRAPNSTLTDWRGLIDEGFPYLKVQLVRDNPFAVSIEGWQHALEAHGYDPALAEDHLARKKD